MLNDSKESHRRNTQNTRRDLRQALTLGKIKILLQISHKVDFLHAVY